MIVLAASLTDTPMHPNTIRPSCWFCFSLYFCSLQWPLAVTAVTQERLLFLSCPDPGGYNKLNKHTHTCYLQFRGRIVHQSPTQHLKRAKAESLWTFELTMRILEKLTYCIKLLQFFRKGSGNQSLKYTQSDVHTVLMVLIWSILNKALSLWRCSEQSSLRRTT